jgi:hypothetical protein
MEELVSTDSRCPVAALRARPLEPGLMKVAMTPLSQVMSAFPGDGSWNGVCWRWEIYATDSASSDPAQWAPRQRKHRDQASLGGPGDINDVTAIMHQYHRGGSEVNRFEQERLLSWDPSFWSD